MADQTYHEQTQKDGTKRYCCDICDWWTPQMVNLEQHMHQQHMGTMVAGEPQGPPDDDDEDDDQPGNRPDVPPGQEEQPGNRPDVPPGQDKPTPEDEPEPAHPIVLPEEPVPTPHASQAVGV